MQPRVQPQTRDGLGRHGRPVRVQLPPRRFHEQPARHVAATARLLARRAERLEKLAAADGGEVLAVAADVTDQASVDAAAERVHTAFGPMDLVVDAAGVMPPNPVDAGRADEWQRMLDTNVGGALRIIRAFTADLLAATAEGRTADLVNISSIGAHLTFPHYAVYGATKAALSHLSASLRTELGPRDVRVTDVEPGLTTSELVGHVDNAELSGQLDGMVDALGELPSDEIADLIAYTSGRARHISLRRPVVLPTCQA